MSLLKRKIIIDGIEIVLQQLPFSQTIGIKRILEPIFNTIYNYETEEQNRVLKLKESVLNLSEKDLDSIKSSINAHVYSFDDVINRDCVDIDALLCGLDLLDIVNIASIIFRGIYEITDDDKKKIKFRSLAIYNLLDVEKGFCAFNMNGAKVFFCKKDFEKLKESLSFDLEMIWQDIKEYLIEEYLSRPHVLPKSGGKENQDCLFWEVLQISNNAINENIKFKDDLKNGKPK